jgi:hypothetical protein
MEERAVLDYDDPDIYELLFEVCPKYGTDPGVPLESELFFRKLLSTYDGTANDEVIRSWLHEQLGKYFICLGQRPRWIQAYEWQFDDNGLPMAFAGQIDLTKSMGEQVVPGFYHDDTSLYVFVGQKIEPVVVLQQF